MFYFFTLTSCSEMESLGKEGIQRLCWLRSWPGSLSPSLLFYYSHTRQGPVVSPLLLTSCGTYTMTSNTDDILPESLQHSAAAPWTDCCWGHSSPGRPRSPHCTTSRRWSTSAGTLSRWGRQSCTWSARSSWTRCGGKHETPGTSRINELGGYDISI